MATRTPTGTDRLTGLEDESTFKARVADAPPGTPVSVLRIVDFEQVNAAWGRDGGDEVLRAVADRLTGAARLAGAEYALLGQGGWPPSRLAQLARPIAFGRHWLRFAVAVGTVTRLAGERGGNTVDRARAAAAAAQTGQAVWWGDRAVSDDGRLAIDLRRALEGEEIALVFQPQVDVTDGRMIGVEALARWDHATLGRVTTARLFAAAAETQFSAALTDHIVDRAVEECAAWPPQLSTVRMSVNVSARDLSHSGFVARLLAKVEARTLAPDRITVEITEDAAMDDPGAVTRAIAELQEAGARLVLDDFGTGQSSLAWLSRLTVDGMKFDRAFTAAAGRGGRAAAILGTLVELTRRLGIGVIAEGVETEREATALADLGCRHQQGFLHAEPMGSTSLTRWVTERA